MKPFVMLLFSSCLFASAMADITVPMHKVNAKGIGKTVGTIHVSESKYGLVFTPDLNGMTLGLHGFHVHENPDCSSSEKEGKVVPAGAAGGHYDPDKTGYHDLPWGNGHLGDLPALYFNLKGRSNRPVLAPRLSLKHLEGRALMIHAGEDNYADTPKPLGGGGARIACGIIK